MRLGASETLHGPRLEHNMGEQLRAIIMGRAAEMPRLGVDRQQADSATTSSRTRGESPLRERESSCACGREAERAGGRTRRARARAKWGGGIAQAGRMNTNERYLGQSRV